MADRTDQNPHGLEAFKVVTSDDLLRERELRQQNFSPEEARSRDAFIEEMRSFKAELRKTKLRGENVLHNDVLNDALQKYLAAVTPAAEQVYRKTLQAVTKEMIEANKRLAKVDEQLKKDAEDLKKQRDKPDTTTTTESETSTKPATRSSRLIQIVTEQGAKQIALLSSIDTKMGALDKVVKAMAYQTGVAVGGGNGKSDIALYLKEMLRLDQRRLAFEKQQWSDEQRQRREEFLESSGRPRNMWENLFGRKDRDRHQKGEGMFGSMTDGLTGGLAALGFSRVLGFLGKGLKWASIAGILITLLGMLGARVQKELERGASLGEAIGQSIGPVLKEAWNVTKWIGEGILEALQEMTGLPLKKWRDDMVEMATDLVATFRRGLGDPQRMKAIAAEIDKIEPVYDVMSKEWDKLLEEEYRLRTEWYSAWWDGRTEDLKDIQSKLDAVNEKLKPAQEMDWELFTKKWDELFEWAGINGIGRWIDEQVTSMANAVSAYVDRRKKAIEENISLFFSMPGRLADFVGGQLAAVVEGISAAIDRVTTTKFWVERLPDVKILGYEPFRQLKESYGIAPSAPEPKASAAPTVDVPTDGGPRKFSVPIDRVPTDGGPRPHVATPLPQSLEGDLGRKAHKLRETATRLQQREIAATMTSHANAMAVNAPTNIVNNATSRSTIVVPPSPYPSGGSGVSSARALA